MALRSAADEAAAALTEATSDQPTDAFVSVPLPSRFDPRALLRDPRTADVVASYERPDQRLALVGLGAAARIDLRTGELPTDARPHLHRLLDGVASEAHDPLRPRLLAGFRFAPDLPAREPWEAFGAGSLVLPRMLFVVDDGHVGVVLAPGTHPEEALRHVQRALDKGFGEGVPSLIHGPLREVRSIDDRAWRDSVATIAEDIRGGAYEKAVLATSIELASDAALPLGATLAQLRSDYPDCHLVSFTVGGATLVCASPELLVNLEDGHARTMGLAASQRRGRTTAEDQALAGELLADEKSRLEHDVVVREIVESLEGAIDDLDVAPEPSVRRLRNIQHLATRISGPVRDGVDVLELVERLNPTPAVCGRPREIARQVIARHETFDRGWYAGPVGWLDAGGHGEFAVALRTALVRGSRATLFAGNGIMGGSDPDAELDEVRLKFRPLAEALGGLVPSEASAIPA
jgi:isochorismate synthase